ncbi:hypothetical protein FM036_46620 [Nostoc sp. HG1]|nr:hypothetical protein [Nostoc sp. HG1]
MTNAKDGIEVSFQEEMLKSGMAYYRKSASICPNHLAFKNAQNLAIASFLDPNLTIKEMEKIKSGITGNCKH